MKVQADIKDTEEMLQEAMQLLDGLQYNMGLFQRQYYGKLKKRFNEHERLGEDLRKVLNVIDTD